ncbi:MAG: transposase [Candidatus Paceibacterota bacterium]|nr:MAG: transposase [Candidatus Paceibacterota bacterium]
MEFYHVLNRGVDKRNIFLDNKDYLRFIHDLFEFNDQNWVNNSLYRFSKIKDIASPYIEKTRQKRKLLVNLNAFCLMPNHYHLLISSKIDYGISKFMKKVNMGYAKYFNEKYERKGALFESRYKRVLVENDAHFIHLPYYIHLNPLDLTAPEWREGKLKDYRQAINFLGSYRWSSHLDYLGEKNFPSVTQRDFMLDFFGGTDGYRKGIRNWLKDISVENFQEVALDLE